MQRAMQALNLFRERTGSQQRFRVHLDKRVPHGAAGNRTQRQLAMTDVSQEKVMLAATSRWTH